MQESNKKKRDKESKVKSTVVVQPSKYKDNSDDSDSEELETQGMILSTLRL